MPNALEVLVREHGAPNCLFSDNAKVQIRKRVRDVLCLCCIKDFQCESEHQHQNVSERKIGDVKRSSSGIMDRTGTPAIFWLTCLFCVIFLLNHMSSDALGGMTPVEEATGIKADISPLLKFHWWEPILHQAKGAFPSNSCKKGGSWCSVAKTQGDILTHLVLTDDTEEVNARSNIRSTEDPAKPNIRALLGFGGMEADDSPVPTLHSVFDLTGLDSPDELLGLTLSFATCLMVMSSALLLPARLKMTTPPITNMLNHWSKGLMGSLMKSSPSINSATSSRISTTRNSMSPTLQHGLSKPSTITKGLLILPAAIAKVTTSLSTGRMVLKHASLSLSWQRPPPLTCALHAKTHDLLDTPGWKVLKHLATQEVKFTQMVKQAKHCRKHNMVPLTNCVPSN
jgi:hypothetical protein